MTRSASLAAIAVSDQHHDHDFNFLTDGASEDAGDEAPSVSSLPPSARLIYDLLVPQISASEKIQRRLAAGRKVCVLVRLPHDDWSEALHLAVCEIITVGARGRVRLLNAEASGTYYDTVVETIARSHLALAVSGDIVPVEIAMLADLDIDLRRIAFDAVRTVIARETLADPTTIVEPVDFDIASLRPAFLDGAIACADSAEEAITIAKLATVDFRKRRQATEAEAGAKLSKSSSRGISETEILRPTAPKVSDLAGYGDAATWAADLARDLGDYEAGVLGWADVDAGCLLVGPPGAGKTLFASALAASAGVAFVATSYADWQSQREGHLGDVTRAIRKRFADAAENAPSILFIDEVDTMPARGTATNAEDWWTAVTTTLLECLDGTSRREGVVVVAACNDATRLDPALVRSGRLDRRFEIALPDETALARIVAHHLPDIDRSATETVATILAGTASGADVARIAREARRVARRDRRAVTAGDLLAIAMPECQLSPLDRRLVALHEAGHAVASLTLGFKVNSLSIVRRDGVHGGVAVECGETMARVSEIERRVIGTLAGRAAEEVVLGEVSGGAAGDLQEASKLIAHMLGQSGLGDRLVPSAPSEAVVEARLRSLYARSLRLVTERRSAVEALADLAIERRVLGRKAIGEFATAHGLAPAGSVA